MQFHAKYRAAYTVHTMRYHKLPNICIIAGEEVPEDMDKLGPYKPQEIAVDSCRS